MLAFGQTQSYETGCQLARNEVYNIDFLSTGLIYGQREKGPLFKCHTSSYPQLAVELVSQAEEEHSLLLRAQVVAP